MRVIKKVFKDGELNKKQSCKPSKKGIISMINITIDDKKISVTEGVTILEAARQANIDIPTLCHLKGINQIRDCRVCIVEVEGRKGFATSCIQKVEEGMVVHTNTPNVLEARRVILDLIISIGLLGGTCALLYKYGLRIYKAGILNYSSSNLWKKMFKSLKN